MRSLITALAIMLLLLAVGPVNVLAAAPDHELISGTDVDTNFCDTGETVYVSFKGVFNGWDDQAFGHITNTWTNPANGVSVVDSFSGGGKFLGFIDDGDGYYTIVSNRVGIPGQIRLEGGPLVSQDVGLVIFYDHFDPSDNYLGTDVVIRGPHPNAESDFSLYCEIMIEALGL